MESVVFSGAFKWYQTPKIYTCISDRVCAVAKSLSCEMCNLVCKGFGGWKMAESDDIY